GRVEHAYETVTSRLPDENERTILLELVADLQKSYSENPALAEEICRGVTLEGADEKPRLAAWTVLVNAIYNLDITKTRE
ncbi:MAG: hypothetical protein NZ935_09935, partial [Planctomycetes bacterium]|nr:hypothetical protein [Planctomycetota bacterium]